MTYSGQPLKRFEDYQLLLGRGSFVDDIKVAGTLHAVVLRSPHPHATIRSIDAAAARRLPGVAAVLTGGDIQGILPDLPTRIEEEGGKGRPPTHPVLAAGKVCYVGQPVAIVVGDDRQVAQDALELIAVTYQPLPAVVDPLEAIEEGSEIVHPDLGTNVAIRLTQGGGDLEAAFAKAEHVVRQRYRVQRLAPAPMECRGVLADYQPQNDSLTVWDSTQNPHGVKGNLARLLGRPENKVRVLAGDVGGGFGEKGCLFPEEAAIPYLAIQLGRPVKWVEERQENMVAFHGRGYTVDVEAACTSDGILLGIKVRILADLGAYFLLSTPTVPVLTSHRLTGPYKTAAMSVEVVGAITNKPPTGAYRGAGGPEAAFCMERTVDLIARDLRLDPAEVRRRNFIEADAFPYETPTGITYDSGDYRRALDRALELAEYPRWKEQARRRQNSEEPLIGVGLATVVKGSGARGPRLTDHTKVIIEPSGRVLVYTGVSPHGQGTETAFAQIAADQLGIIPSQVQVLHGDSDDLPGGGGTSASRALVVGGSGVHALLQEARQKLSLIAAPLLGCPAEEVVFQEGKVFGLRSPAHATTFSRVAAAAYNEELLPPGTRSGLEFRGRYSLDSSPYAFGAHVAVVEISRETGSVKILRYVAVHDSGRIINPLLAEGQVQGAIAQGIGQALLEGMAYSSDGQPLTGSLMDYALPVAGDLPDLTLETVETPSPLNPLGAKGIGELPTVAAPVAVANAVMDALASVGVVQIDTPFTPEKIWQALQRGAAAT